MRFALVAIVFGIAAPVAAAGPAGFTRARVLEPAASDVAGKPVKVWCARTQSSWDSFVAAQNGANNGEHGLADVPGAQAYLDPTVCFALRHHLRPGSFDTGTFPPAVEILTHEAVHLRGELDEGVTDCTAVRTMSNVATRYFAVTPGAQLRSLMAAAKRWRAKAAPAYRSVC